MINVVDLLFPPHCVACHRLGTWLCAGCLEQIDRIHPPVCNCCGLPVEPPAPICDLCRRGSPPWLPQLDGLRTYAFHHGPLRQAIHQVKYEDLRALAPTLGRLMADGWASLAPPDTDLDVVVPVPLHASRQRQRGYNQSALLARELGAHLARPVVEDVLIRSKATVPQVGLKIDERRANVQGAFQCLNHSLSGKRVLLVDDVYTTGSTLEAACIALRDAGAALVWAYTLVRARGG